MNLDDKVCYCFHVSHRKLVNWVRLNNPKVPSQLSECGGAGTGCGWCIPFLKQIFKRGMAGKVNPACQPTIPDDSLTELTPEEYAAMRAEYVKAGHGVPPEGAEPLPDSERNQG
ncbi:MAG: (2Fe-2S)-binding protein [Planctomycetes bacterium]|nr:(2Fe-2S)-binding protein [Planctomycetota bacterium]